MKLVIGFLLTFAAGLVVLFVYSEWRYRRAVKQAEREKSRG
jgi:hypothetical protein